ncbi:MAG: hypothetical protein JWM37_862 [Candidatus Saccharibacteria bacterium]|nr:hypothetical protein [Candidatus Saccharibacteria bacterium]
MFGDNVEGLVSFNNARSSHIPLFSHKTWRRSI